MEKNDTDLQWGEVDLLWTCIFIFIVLFIFYLGYAAFTKNNFLFEKPKDNLLFEIRQDI